MSRTFVHLYGQPPRNMCYVVLVEVGTMKLDYGLPQ